MSEPKNGKVLDVIRDVGIFMAVAVSGTNLFMYASQWGEYKNKVEASAARITRLEEKGSGSLAAHSSAQEQRDKEIELRLERLEKSILQLDDIKQMLSKIVSDLEWLTGKRTLPQPNGNGTQGSLRQQLEDYARQAQGQPFTK